MRTSLPPKLGALAGVVAAFACTAALWPSGALAQIYPAMGWIQVANEGQWIDTQAADPVVLRYGAGSSFTYRTVPADSPAPNSYTCSNAFFGFDPTPGVPKRCDMQGSWTHFRNDGDNFGFTTGQLRYGATVSGVPHYAYLGVWLDSGFCTSYSFGVDPAPGSVESCDIAVPSSTLGQ